MRSYVARAAVMKILRLDRPPPEHCPHGAPHEREPARELVEPKSEKRLVAALREAARTCDAKEILVRAAVTSYRSGGGVLARAMADLAATGRAAATSLARHGDLGADDVASLAAERLEGVRSGDAVLRAHARRVVERAQIVSTWVASDAAKRAELEARHPELAEWVGISGEDDAPHRPVNVPFTDKEQRSITVSLRDATLVVRYTIAGATDGSAPLVLLLHGHSSRAEELDRLMSALAGRERDGRPKYCVVSPDLPGCGYTSRIAHECIAPMDAPGAPMLELHDEFVEAFTKALAAELGVEPKLACVAGGSLGGNLVLRLAERRPTWIQRFAAWSPASVWSSLTGDLVKGLGISRTRKLAWESEEPRSRRAYFKEVFATPICLTRRTQPEMWYRDSLACRPRHIQRALFDRREVYDSLYRRWHWRVVYEQLVFSHVQPANGVAPWERIRGPLLLLAGSHDNFMWSHIYERTRDLALRLGSIGVRGACLLLGDTGHSIHDERPAFLADALDTFIDRYA